MVKILDIVSLNQEEEEEEKDETWRKAYVEAVTNERIYRGDCSSCTYFVIFARKVAESRKTDFINSQ